jgi:proteic killer suppression protein
MLNSFKDTETEKVFNRYFSKNSPPTLQRSALLQLRSLNQARNINDLHNSPSNHLVKLHADRKRKGKYSIRINKQWRISFIWDGNNASEVEIAQYHSNRGAS